MIRTLESVTIILIKNFNGLLTVKRYRTEIPVLQAGHIHKHAWAVGHMVTILTRCSALSRLAGHALWSPYVLMGRNVCR